MKISCIIKLFNIKSFTIQLKFRFAASKSISTVTSYRLALKVTVYFDSSISHTVHEGKKCCEQKQKFNTSLLYLHVFVPKPSHNQIYCNPSSDFITFVQIIQHKKTHCKSNDLIESNCKFGLLCDLKKNL